MFKSRVYRVQPKRWTEMECLGAIFHSHKALPKKVHAQAGLMVVHPGFGAVFSAPLLQCSVQLLEDMVNLIMLPSPPSKRDS